MAERTTRKKTDPMMFNEIKAGCFNHISEIESLESDMTLRNTKGENLLIYAARISNTRVVEILLDSQMFDIDDRDDKGNNVLIAACYAGNLNIARIILKHTQINIDARNNDNNNALYYAIKSGQMDLVKLLFMNGARLARIGKESILFEVIESNHEEMLELLLQNGASVNECNERGESLLVKAIRSNRYEMIKLLLKYQPCLKDEAKEWYSIERNLVRSKNTEIIKLYLEYIKESERSKKYYNLLTTALHEEKELFNPILALVYEKVGTVELKNSRGVTLLMEGVSEGDYKIVHKLLEYKVDIHQLDEEGQSALFYISGNPADPYDQVEEDSIGERIAIIKLLQDSGIDINHRSYMNKNALYSAIEKECLGVVKGLIGHGIDINNQDITQTTALIKAVKEGNEKLVAFLLDSGADKDLKDNECNRAVDYIENLWSEENKKAIKALFNLK